jgi:hypothetical protein
MKETKLPVQRLVKREAVITFVSIALAALYQSLWYLAPDFLTIALWRGGTLTIAFALGTLAILAPIASAFYIAGRDAPTDEVFEISHH